MIKPIAYLGLIFIFSVSFADNEDSVNSVKDLQQRVSLLELALAPASAKEAADAWAKAAQTRNGALQYMLMCSNLQKANVANLKALNWVTGVSSPWVSSYKIIPGVEKDNTTAYTIQYQLSTGEKDYGSSIDQIEVIFTNDKNSPSIKWCINKFNYLSPVDGIKK